MASKYISRPLWRCRESHSDGPLHPTREDGLSDPGRSGHGAATWKAARCFSKTETHAFPQPHSHISSHPRETGGNVHVESQTRTLTVFVCNGPNCKQPKCLYPGQGSRPGWVQKGTGR